MATLTLRKAVGVGPTEPLPAFAWPGGYPLLYLDKDGEVMCAVCATVALDTDESPPESYHVFYEGSPVECAVCDKRQESAYGDPDEEDFG